MIKILTLTWDGKKIYIPIQDFFDKYYSKDNWMQEEYDKAWEGMQEELIEKAFSCKNEKESREV